MSTALVELLRAVWGPEHYTDTHYLRVYIGQLRRKLEPDPARPRHLITEPNRGYRFHVHRNRRALTAGRTRAGRWWPGRRACGPGFTS